MLRVMHENDITFVKGSPGTGKTFLAVGYGLQKLLQHKYDQLVFTRPVVEAGGEKLGFLPGNMYEKIDPYMIPIFDALSRLVPPGILSSLMPRSGNGNDHSSYPIRILPLAYMRGLTYLNSFVILDEMQNSTPEQMRMALTRLGDGSKMVLCGDVYQTDIHHENGLGDAFKLLQDIDGLGFVSLSEDAIMRHPVIKQIEGRYQKRFEERRKNSR